MMFWRAIRRAMVALGLPLPVYEQMRHDAEEARTQRLSVQQDRASRDFARTINMPPVWRQDGNRRDH